MESVLSVIFMLGLSFCLHSFFHRRMVAQGKRSLSIVLVYFVGLLGLYIQLYSRESPWMWSSLVLYLLCSGILSYLYLTIFLGGETPSSMILTALTSKKHMTKQEILHLFSERILIWKRIEDLRAANLITEDKLGIRITDRGHRIIALIALYRKLFHLPVGG